MLVVMWEVEVSVGLVELTMTVAGRSLLQRRAASRSLLSDPAVVPDGVVARARRVPGHYSDRIHSSRRPSLLVGRIALTSEATHALDSMCVVVNRPVVGTFLVLLVVMVMIVVMARWALHRLEGVPWATAVVVW